MTLLLRRAIASSVGTVPSVKFMYAEARDTTQRASIFFRHLQFFRFQTTIFQDNLFLVYTNITRRANDIANTFVKDLNGSKKIYIKKIIEHATLGKKLILNSKFDDFGLLLGESWNVKKKLSPSISNELIDNIYNLALKSGSSGGKLLGAGGGGFFLFYVPKKNHDRFRSSFLKKNLNLNTSILSFHRTVMIHLAKATLEDLELILPLQVSMSGC